MELLNPGALDPELLEEIRRLHFATRRLADRGVAGSYRSAFRGRGIEFEEVREYIPGDEIRSIDWKVTARTGLPHIKSYREERELTVLIAVDVSSSTLTGTRKQLRDRIIAKVGALLTLVALQNNDKVGLVTFSDRLETFHPPRKARSSVWRILHEVLSVGTYRPTTDLGALFSFMSSVLKQRAIIFVLSDFHDDGYERELAGLSKRHDVTAVTVVDPADWELPEAGLLRVRDPESGRVTLLDTSHPRVREEYTLAGFRAREERLSVLRRHGVGVLELSTSKPFVGDLRRYLEVRGSRAYGR